MAIVQNIMEILEQQCQLHDAKKIVRVNLEFGALTGVMPSAVEFAFEVLSKGTIAEGAELDIRIIPIKIYCFDCAKEIILDTYEPFCPVCGSATVNIIEGRSEMRIASLEVDDS
ncbi:MAG TPA: hydrogenase maturation nickel metallochaperone HypA [Desulfomonilaceae bacterium]|nr:hydrogenase maturation nickel metallochaperone HypA [Desulfomonilaceae bacterium]